MFRQGESWGHDVVLRDGEMSGLYQKKIPLVSFRRSGIVGELSDYKEAGLFGHLISQIAEGS